MAVRVKRSDLNTDQVETIRKLLCLQPVTPPVFGGNRYNSAPSKPPILFYLFDENTENSQHATVTLPFTFSRVLTGKPPNVDLQYPMVSFAFKGELFEHQKPLEEEAYSQLKEKGATTVGLYPGFGKTVVGAKLSSRLSLYTLILYHRDFLGPQWEKTYQDFTNATCWIAGTVPAPRQMPAVTFCMDTRVHLLPPEYRSRIGCLIIDEAHAFCTPSRVECLLGFTPKYVIAETATLERDDGMHAMIQAICGTHGIFRTSTKPFDVIKLETGYEPPTQQTAQGRLDWAALVRTLAFEPYRNSLILSMITNNPTRKIVILTGLIDHVNYLVKAISDMGEKVDSMAGNKKTYSDSRILVGTIQKIGTGFDEKTACPDFNGVRIDMLILVTSVKKLSTLEQSVGRVFRAEFPVVVDFVDNNSTLKSHWYQRQKWYKSRCGNVTVKKMLPTAPTTKVYNANGDEVVQTPPQATPQATPPQPTPQATPQLTLTLTPQATPQATPTPTPTLTPQPTPQATPLRTLPPVPPRKPKPTKGKKPMAPQRFYSLDGEEITS